MPAKSFAVKIDSVIVQKFSSLISGVVTAADKINSIDITPQIQEIDIFQSIFSPVIRCEIGVADLIGLFVNFPLTGEEAVVIRYQGVDSLEVSTLYMVIESISHINVSDDARNVSFMLNCVALEAWANAKQTVQQSYHDTTAGIAQKVFDQHIVERLKTVVPGYVPQPFFKEDNDSQDHTFVIPNMAPLAAISMLAEKIAVSETPGKYSFIFFQNLQGFHFTTIQGLYDATLAANARRKAFENRYVYISNESEQESSIMKNDGRIATNLVFNRRFGSMQKIKMGYFHNTLFEINIAQKAVWGQPTFLEGVNSIYPNKLNTSAYQALVAVEGDEEQSNRTLYAINNQRENDAAYPVSRYRERWGLDTITLNGMSQIDLTISIPGNDQLNAGDLFYLDMSEAHGFNDVKEDDLISGFFLITEVKHVVLIGGFHTTVLRINKDSYKTTVDRASRYV